MALAIPAAFVGEVVRAGPVTPVAGTAAWVRGVTAVRGRVVAVADVCGLVGTAPAAGEHPGTDAWLVVVDDGRRAAALAGLRVHRIVACAPDDAATDGPEVPPGLPVHGVVRLVGDSTRGADALPPVAASLDVAALLDLVHEPSIDGA